MPIRLLREGILTSERVDKLAPQAELFYRRLMSVVDDYGRFSAHPRLIRAACYPLRIDEVREADISRWLTEVQLAGLIALYAVKGKRFLEVIDFKQRTRTPSKYPSKDDADAVCLTNDRNPPTNDGLGVCADECVGVDSSEPPLADSEPPPLLTFVCVGSGPKEWHLTEEKLSEYELTFPGMDVLAECRKARQWCIDNPSKRKTHRGTPAFLTRWLSNAQDSGRGAKKQATSESKVFDPQKDTWNPTGGDS